MLLENSFLFPYLFCNVEFKFSWFYNPEQSSETLILKIEILLESQNKTDIEIIGFQLMHFGFVLDLSDIDVWNIALLDTHIDLLDTDIPSKQLVCLLNVFKTSIRHVFKTSSRHVQDVLKTSSVKQFFVLQDVLKWSCKMSSRRLLDVLEEEKLLRWRRVEEVFKTFSRPTNVCWVQA